MLQHNGNRWSLGRRPAARCTASRLVLGFWNGSGVEKLWVGGFPGWGLPDAPLAGGSGGLSSSAAAQFERVISGAVERDGVGVLELGIHSGLIDWGTADLKRHPGTLEFGGSL